MSWMSKKTGRPREEDGHKRINISIDKFTAGALDKIRKGDGNVSRFIEKQLRPVLENLDPGEASIHVWRIEAYLSQQIIKATEQNKPDTVIALASIATAIKDFRNLCGIPPGDLLFDQDVRVRKQLHKPRKESVVLTFVTAAIASIFGFITLQGLSKTVLPTLSNQTGLEGFAMKMMVQVSPYLILVPAVVLAFTFLLNAKPAIQRKLRFLRHVHA